MAKKQDTEKSTKVRVDEVEVERAFREANFPASEGGRRRSRQSARNWIVEIFEGESPDRQMNTFELTGKIGCFGHLTIKRAASELVVAGVLEKHGKRPATFSRGPNWENRE